MKNFTSGKYTQQFEYQSFSPSLINRNFTWEDKEIDVYLESAVKALTELKAITNFTPNVDGFIKLHVVKEATYSNRIEGTRTSIDEALLPELNIDIERREDWKEVQNYINAMNYAVCMIEKVPFSIRLINETHKVLLEGVRGKYKLPGEIRKSQNWIGGYDIKSARYVPPHFSEISDLLSDWEKFWHNKDVQVPILIKIAIMHYQFESIHPYLDGNGRIGRLIIILQLIDSKFLDKPILYLSNFIEKNRSEYYELLRKVKNENTLYLWVKFILIAFRDSALESITVLNKLQGLTQEYMKLAETLGRRTQLAIKLIEYMFGNPIISVNIAKVVLDVTFPTANAVINDLTKLNVLRLVNQKERDRLYSLHEYIEAFQ
ncbi:MAG: Fic family protein [bacterium]